MEATITCIGEIFKTRVKESAEQTYNKVLEESERLNAKRIEELKAALAIEQINLEKDSQSLYNSSSIGLFRSVFGCNKMALNISRMRMDATFKRFMEIKNELESLGVVDF